MQEFNPLEISPSQTNDGIIICEVGLSSKVTTPTISFAETTRQALISGVLKLCLYSRKHKFSATCFAASLRFQVFKTAPEVVMSDG